VREPVGRHAVAQDARPLHQQLAEYNAYAASLRVLADLPGEERARIEARTEDARRHIVDAFCLCEDVHGYGAICEHVFLVGALIACCEAALWGGYMRVALTSGHANAGMLTGLLVEQLAGVQAGARKFLAAPAAHHDHSPHMTFGDCVLGTNVARALGELTDEVLDAGAPYASLAYVARRTHGKAGKAEIRRICNAAMQDADSAHSFITHVLASEILRCAVVSVPWTTYMTRRLTGVRST
jgi:hypothetical protein